jgi:major membrane immunogen (membrane-anchored lipoprotein)
MKGLLPVSAIATTLLFFGCSSQEEMAPKPAPAPAPAAKAPPATEAKAPAPEKSAEKAKATKIAGDIGLLDTEKNYLIVVTKDGKLVTVDFDPKFQPTELKPEPAKIADIGLGSQAVVQYTKQGEKNVATSVEYRPAKGE